MNEIPEVGSAATICHWSDRDPATVSRVSLFKSGAREGQVRAVWVREDSWRLVSGSEANGSARYEYERNPEAPEVEFRANARGRLVQKGGGSTLAIGQRRRYYDPHF